jgi:hypothetical protein
MTLIQTLMSDDLVIQVSDRRLTDGRTGAVVDDQYTKLVCWNFSFSIGFTGLARIDRAQRKSTSEWIAETICDHRVFEHGVEALGRAASERIRTLPNAWPDRRLGIVVAGFDGRDAPLVAEVSNFDVGGPMPADPRLFNIKYGHWLAGQPVRYQITGAGLTEKWQRQLLMQRVPRALKKPKPEGITYAVKLMVAVQRSVAKTNETVGTDAMAVTIPRTTFGEQILRQLNGQTLMSNLDGTNIIGGSNGPEFAYFDTQGFKFRQFGPHNAANGMAVADLLGTADPDNPDNQTMSIRILKFPSPPSHPTGRK